MSTIYLVGAFWVTGYVLACAVWPYRRCSRCEGSGKRPLTLGQDVAGV